MTERTAEPYSEDRCRRCGGAPEQTLHVETGQAWRFAFRHKTGCRLFDPSVYFYADAIPIDAGRT